jgi:hypothetical protein
MCVNLLIVTLNNQHFSSLHHLSCSLALFPAGLAARPVTLLSTCAVLLLLQVAGLPPVTKEWFEARKAQLTSASAAPHQKIWYDPLTKRKFQTQNTYQVGHCLLQPHQHGRPMSCLSKPASINGPNCCSCLH